MHFLLGKYFWTCKGMTKEGHFRRWHGRRMLKLNTILGLNMVGILYYSKTKYILNFNHHGNTLQKLMANMA